MRIAMVLTPLNRPNLTLATQIGVTDVVARCPGIDLQALMDTRDQIEEFPLKMTVIEGYLPIKDIIEAGPDRPRQLDEMSQLIENMGRVGATLLCYSFMQTMDLTRTSWSSTVRGGAVVNSFDAADLAGQPPLEGAIDDPEQKWDNLAWFLERILPVCESAGVKLAMHPDDPPLSPLLGEARIMSCIEDFERLISLSDSPSNGICFCCGCFSEMGVDVPETIKRLGSHISYAHFRDVEGCVPKFNETFHDIGQSDMFSVMSAFHDIGFESVMRPDHVPVLEGEQSEGTGYTMMGRLFAVGYMRGLMHAVGA